MGQYLKDRKGFKKYDVLDGEKSPTNPFTYRKSLNGHRLVKVNPNSLFDICLSS